MKPVEELLGKTITDISVDELEAEITEREGLRRDIEETPRWHLSGPVTYQLSDEIYKLTCEVARLQMLPAIDFPKLHPIDAEVYFQGFREGMKHTRRLGGIKKNAKLNKIKLLCITKADEIWEKEPDARIGDVITGLQHYQKELGVKQYGHDAIDGWLKAAKKAGLLVIPEAASRAGRNEK